MRGTGIDRVSPLTGPLLLVASLVVVLASAELATCTLLVAPHDFAPTLASKRWFERYWRPLNRFGIRDREWVPEALSGRRTVFLVGDSLAAGHGIAHVEERCGAQLERRLGPGWAVLTVASPGWDTRVELQMLRRMPVRPDVVVLAYNVNDVIGAAAPYGYTLGLQGRIAIRPDWLAPLVSHSSLANALYWRIWGKLHRPELGTAYRDALENGFMRPEPWLAHATDLRAMYTYASDRGAAFLAVVTPDLGDVEWSRRYTDRVVRLFAEDGARVVDLGERFAGRNSEDLVLSAYDHHPNVRTHAEIAEAIRDALRSAGVVRGEATAR